jgi:hypothetical protein
MLAPPLPSTWSPTWSTTCRWPCVQAAIRGVCPASFACSADAPKWSRFRTASWWPAWAATRSGALPSAIAALALAPRLQNAGDDRVVPALGRDQQWGAPVRRGGVDRRPLVEQERHRNGRAVQARHVERRVAVAARPAGLRRRVAFPVAFPPMLPADGGCPRRVLEQAGGHLEVSARGEAASVRAVLPSRRSAALRSMRSTPCSRSLATVRSCPAFFQRQV